MPVLYSADITEIAKPVKKERKPRTKKSTPTEDVQVQTDQPTAQPIDKQTGKQTEAPPAPKKEKKPATEKQLAALKKAQETKKRKREEKLAAEPAPEAGPSAPVEKKKRQKTVSVETMSTDTRIDHEVEKLQKKRAPRKLKDPADPPKWFVQYVSSVKKEESKLSDVKKPQKVIAEEAGAQAKSSWQNGLVRDRVQNEVDSHMTRIYSMIFGARRMH